MSGSSAQELVMKRIRTYLLLFCLLLTLCGCGNTLRGTDALMEKAREIILLADADTIDMRYAGMCAVGDEALIWFISGNEYQAHSYWPMVCTIVDENEYRFNHLPKPMDRGTDIAVLQWQGGYAFLVNNPDCAVIELTDSTGTRRETIEKDAYPYVYYHSLIPSEYRFLDKDGNEI